MFRNFVPDCIRSNSERYIYKFKIFLGGMPPYPPSRHTCVSHITIILLPSCSPLPLNSKSCMNPNVHAYMNAHIHNTTQSGEEIMHCMH